MPKAPPRTCSHPGCPHPAYGRFCPTHTAQNAEREKARKRQYDQGRPPARQRGYSTSWERLRMMKLNVDPLCQRCRMKALAVPAVLVHHLDHDAKNNALENLMSLCQPCHEAEHKRGFCRPEVPR